jgi:hypothetical protein
VFLDEIAYPSDGMRLKAYVSLTEETTIPLYFERVREGTAKVEDGVLVFETYGNDTLTYVANILWWTTDAM